MPTVELTTTVVKTLACAPGATETVWWDKSMPGFGLRCRASGNRVWFVQYRTKDGTTRRVGLEASPKDMSLAKARAKAKDMLADVTKKRDPAAEAGKVLGLMTLADLASAYLARQAKTLRPGSYAAVVRHLGDFYRPLKQLRNRKVATITARDVIAALDQVAENHGPIAANRLRATLRSMWAWGLKSQLVTAVNPVTDTFKPGKEVRRDRVLTDAELALVWSHAGGGAYGAIVRLLLLTGQRREEVAGMRWSEITLQTDGSALWVLPAGRAKNGLAHEVPLLPAAVALLPARRDEGEDHVRDLVFGGGKGGTHAAWAEQRATKYAKPVKHGEDSFSAWSRSKDRLDGRIAKANGNKEKPAPLPRWTLHDLRRTFVTGTNNLGVEPHVVEAAVNHVSGDAKGGVAGVYNRSRYTPQVRAAMKVWADHVAGLVASANTVDQPA